jgi:hypothetical protein
MNYNPNQWYWIVGNDPINVFSSVAAAEVSQVSDSGYLSFLSAGNHPSRVSGYAVLYDVLVSAAPAVATAATSFFMSKNALTTATIINNLLNSGITITSIGNSSLNGTYPCDPATQIKVVSIVTGINSGKGLPDGNSSYGVMDMSGNVNNFSATDYINLSAAIESYVYNLYATETTLLAGGNPSWPSPNITIA